MKNKDEIVKRMEATGFRLFVSEDVTTFLFRMRDKRGEFFGDYIVTAHEDNLLIFINKTPSESEERHEDYEFNFFVTDEQIKILDDIRRQD